MTTVRQTKLRLWRHKNVWIAFVLIVANGLAWFQVSSRIELPQVAPVLHPEIGEIRAHWQARDAVGESFEVTVTDQMAMETIAWFIDGRTELPFSTPYVEIHEDHVIGGGIVKLMGLQTPVIGEAKVWLENGKVTGEVQSLRVAGTAAPQFIVNATDQAKAIYDDLSFPIEITAMELREGEVVIEGVYR